MNTGEIRREKEKRQELRDELAMRAMTAMIASGATYQKWEHLSLDAYALADAMLKERSK